MRDVGCNAIVDHVSLAFCDRALFAAACGRRTPKIGVREVMAISSRRSTLPSASCDSSGGGRGRREAQERTDVNDEGG